MTDGNEVRRKRLLYQSTHRGTKEADLILGGFARAHMASMSSDELAQFEALLEESDPDLMAWIGEEAAPLRWCDTPLLRLIYNFKKSSTFRLLK